MTMTRSQSLAGFLFFVSVGMCTTACDSVGSLFQPGVTVVIENATGFHAVPDIQTANSRNLAEDLFAAPQEVDAAGSVPPNQTATLRFDCDGELELISFRGVRFEDAGGFGFGDADVQDSWRRDVDFDCGDTIRIRLTGTVFFFDATANVERSLSFDGGNDDQSTGNNSDDIGNLIDRLLGS